MAEIQGLSAGAGGAGLYSLAGLGSDPNSGPSANSQLFFSLPGGERERDPDPAAAAAAAAGRGTVGYLGPGLQAGGAAEAAARGMGNGGGAEEKKKGGAALDVEDLGDPLSPRNREYRRKMTEMDAAHRVRIRHQRFHQSPALVS